jgi:addiction module HigA family antidote
LPGATLKDLLEERGMSQKQLAERTGLTPKAINEIVKGKVAITSDTALKLERALGTAAEFWLAREQHYQEWRARVRAQEQQSASAAWLRTVPVRTLIKLGVVRELKNKADQVGEVFRFFGVASQDAWHDVYAAPQAAFRRSSRFESNVAATAAWLRIGEIQAESIRVDDFSADRFREVLKEAVGLTRQPFAQSADRLRVACASAGVAVVYVAEVKGCRASGVTRWLSPGKALIQLSDRYKAEDHLWFTFFHESGHILLHGKKQVFLEGGGSGTDEEQEADRFARDQLIPQAAYSKLLTRAGPGYSAELVRAFADEVGVAPGIVVGRLQHDRLLPYESLRQLKVTLAFPGGM